MSFSTLDYSCLDDINIGGLWTALTAAIQPDNVTLLNSPDQSEPSSSRFAEPVTEQTLVQLKEATTPSGTRTATNWAYMTVEVQRAEKKSRSYIQLPLTNSSAVHCFSTITCVPFKWQLWQLIVVCFDTFSLKL